MSSLRIATLSTTLVVAATAASCDGGARTAADAAVDATVCPAPNVVRPRSEPIEFVGISVERTVTPEAFVALVDPLFGAGAQAGHRHTNYELQPGLLLTSTDDSRTADQAVVSLAMVPSRPAGAAPRTILRVPVSYAYGRVFMDACAAALATANATFASDPSSARPWELEYRVSSVNGGALTLHLEWDAGVATFRVITEDPRTSLRPGSVNHPAFEGDPYETVAGTVNFNLSRDEFAFFSNRAYGVTAGAGQNFQDFQLLPHNWLRLTVTPRLADQLVDVSFEVLTVDGRRVPLARAPASFLAGEQFQQNVFRLVDNMLAQETAAPGSSTPWTAPFHYDDPEGGGVVSVIATGRRGVFSIAYAVESPTHRLRDVDFVPYTAALNIPTMPPSTMMQTCEQLGSTTAVRGRFRVTFNASAEVRGSTALDGPLRGNVWGSVFRAEDVTIGGPRDGAVPVANFHFENVDVTDPAHLMAYEIPTDISAGRYQILGFMDTDNNASATDPSADVNDPVTLPIGAYTLACASQPVTVEFALLLPPGH